MVGKAGFEPATPCSQSRCAARLRHFPRSMCGASAGTRTPTHGVRDRCSRQLSYRGVVWLVGFEPTASSSRTKRAAKLRHSQSTKCRDGGIRTRGLWSPRPARCQAAPHPDQRWAVEDSNLRSPWTPGLQPGGIAAIRTTQVRQGSRIRTDIAGTKTQSDRHLHHPPMCGAPSRIRTDNRRFTRAMLWPVELSRQAGGGSDGDRTRDLRRATPTLYQLSYTPE